SPVGRSAGRILSASHPPSNPAPPSNPHSALAPPVPNFPRLRALALFGRRPPQRVEGFVMPASKNLHRTGRKAIVSVASRRINRVIVAQSETANQGPEIVLRIDREVGRQDAVAAKLKVDLFPACRRS